MDRGTNAQENEWTGGEWTGVANAPAVVPGMVASVVPSALRAFGQKLGEKLATAKARLSGMPSCVARLTTTGDVSDRPNVVLKLNAKDSPAVSTSRAFGRAEGSRR